MTRKKNRNSQENQKPTDEASQLQTLKEACDTACQQGDLATAIKWAATMVSLNFVEGLAQMSHLLRSHSLYPLLVNFLQEFLPIAKENESVEIYQNIRRDLVDALLHCDKFQEAKQLIDEMLKEGMSGLKVQRVQCCLRLEEFDEAETFAREAISDGEAGAKEVLADVLYARDRYQEAEELLAPLFRNGANVGLKLACCLYFQDREDEAIWVCHQQMARGNQGDVLPMLFLCLSSKQRFHQALDILVLLQQMGRLDAIPLEPRTHVYINLGMWPQALQCIENLLAQDFCRKHVEAKVQCLQEMDRYDEVLPFLSQASRKLKGETFWFHRGNVHTHQNNFYEAARCYRKALDCCEPDAADACVSLGKIYLVQRQHDLALQYFQEAQMNGAQDAAYNMALAYCEMGALKEAESWIKNAERQNGDSPELNYVRGCILMKQNKTKEAVAILSDCVDHEEWRALIRLADISAAEKDDEKATRLYALACEKGAINACASFGHFLLKRNETRLGLFYLERAWNEERDYQALTALCFKAAELPPADFSSEHLEKLRQDAKTYRHGLLSRPRKAKPAPQPNQNDTPTDDQ
ncbi:MAG: tetratricopeptide repeat protein [Oligosphaeraceae bacterium]